ncbi:hypothetical protein D3C78_1950670 [compost metagenome]
MDWGEASYSLLSVALAALFIDWRCSVVDAADDLLGVVVVQPANSRPATPIAAAMPVRRKTGKVSNMELSFFVVVR